MQKDFQLKDLQRKRTVVRKFFKFKKEHQNKMYPQIERSLKRFQNKKLRIL